METALLIYLIEVTGNLRLVLLSASIGSGVMVPLVAFTASMEGKGEEWAGKIKALFIFSAVALVTTVLLPSKATMHVMVAAYLGQEIVQSETVQRVAPKALAVLEEYLDTALTPPEGEQE